MAAKPLCFLHAANLQLDCPLLGTGLLNDDIRDIVDVATLTAFDRLITASIDKDVDALFITGNTFDANSPSLAAEVALREGFQRLADRHIPVFVTPGPLDPAAAWHDIPRFPDNVTVFTELDEESVNLTDHNQPFATVLPVATDGSFEVQPNLRVHVHHDRPFVIGLALSDREAPKKEKQKNRPPGAIALDWLLAPSGVIQDSTQIAEGILHLQHAAQGLNHAETGVLGATLQEVDSQRRTRRTSVPLAPVRWERLTQSIDGIRGRDDLLERMISQLERLPHFKGEQARIIEWKLDRASGDAHGWELESSAKELAESLTELSDQPDGLRYVHRVHPLDPDLTLIEPAHREVLTEFLLALERRPASNSTIVAKWLADARLGNVLKPGSWEHWTESLSARQVTERAQQLGWKWFASIGKK